MQMTGAKIVIETLIEQGCDVLFGYPGGQVIDLFDELYRSRDRIRHVLTAHEQGAAHAADGYARATGKVGVVMATSGPGATNLITGIGLSGFCVDGRNYGQCPVQPDRQRQLSGGRYRRREYAGDKA